MADDSNVLMDSFWEKSIYASGKHFNLYPYDSVVSFIFRNYPREKLRNEINILEIGCGAGNNLWFMSREGFRTYGIDISQTAISFAQKRFASENLPVELKVGSFLELPWANETMDLCIDRCSLACVSFSDQIKAIQEVKRVLRPGGLFFYNGYSDKHISAHHGYKSDDGRVVNIDRGTLQGVGGIGFLSPTDVYSLFGNGWDIKCIEHVEVTECTRSSNEVHAEWRVISQRV